MKCTNIRLWARPIVVLALAAACPSQSGPSEEDQEIQNLRAFAKLYGYVKYFHPSDEASEVDWDRFSVFGTRKVRGAKDRRALKTALEQLFLPIAPTIQIYDSTEKPDSPFQRLPDDTAGLRVVAWQHEGLGLGCLSSDYRSIRLNRDNRFVGGRFGFGMVSQSIDGIKYRGRDIRLVAFVRANVRGTGNRGQLWLRVDRETGEPGFSDNMDTRPIASRDWRAYEIQGKVDKDAARIGFGCFLTGTGQVWVDEFRLVARGPNNEWNPIETDNPGFEDDENNRPKMWQLGSNEYAYRTDRANPYEGNKALLIESRADGYSGSLFAESPRIGEVVSKELDGGLFCRVPLALYSDENRTLGQNNRFSWSELRSELDDLPIDQLTADSEYIRLGNVVSAWNVFQHFYPYFDVVNVDWDSELTNSLRQALINKNEKEFFYTLSSLIAKLGDGHARVFHRIQEDQAGLPFLVDWIEDKVVITSSEAKTDFRKGDIISMIDGVSAEQALLDDEQYISGSPQWKRYNSLRRFGYGEEGSPAELVIKRDSKALTIRVPRTYRGEISTPTRPDIAGLEDGIYYVDLTRATIRAIERRIGVLADARGVIFDLRGYPKGNHEVISYLLREKDTTGGWMRVPQIVFPDHENGMGFKKTGWQLEPREPRIKGKAIFLVDAGTISYAESFACLIEHHKLGDIVGQPTAGANGHANFFKLPGGFLVTWTGMKVVKPDGSQHHLIGIRPTVPVERTIRAVIEGRDEFIERAVALINQ
jgi:C-terminal processing protease CtpA/Prc